MNCASCGTTLPDSALFCPGCGQRITVQRRAAVGVPARPGASPPSSLPQDELNAAIAARQELGERLEPEVVETFLARVEHAIAARVDARVEERLRRRRVSLQSRQNNLTARIAASLGIGIPLTAIAGSIGGVEGITGVWFSIVALNVVYTWAEMKMHND